MDGFAVRAADTPGTLPVVAGSQPGGPPGARCEPGEAMGIATGGVVPEGADAVIPIEHVVENDNGVEIGGAVVAGRATCDRAAATSRAGDEVVAAGTRLGPAQLGALAAAGVAEVACGTAAARRRAGNGNRASPPGRAARAGPDLRGERAGSRRSARVGGR